MAVRCWRWRSWPQRYQRSPAQDRVDTKIANAISREIDRYPQLTIFDFVSGTVENGAVTLTGKVTMPYKKDDIGRKAATVDGVQSVKNAIEVLPVSSVRRRTAAAHCSRDLRQLGLLAVRARANPPIRIIVERGHVTLTGVVRSAVDRMLARTLATGFGELSVTNDLRTDAEMRSE